MRAIDFEYDGKRLSDFGFIICNFDGSSGVNVASAGSQITFNKLSQRGGKKQSVYSTTYEECITAEFDICKNDYLFEKDEMEITKNEYRNLFLWLNRNDFHKFNLIYDVEDSTKYRKCYYNVSFNISKITIGDKLYGLRLTLESDMPYGYGEKIVANLGDEYPGGMFFFIQTDECGFAYPNIKITCMEDGTLEFGNTNIQNNKVIIENVKSGEVITMDGENKIITTSMDSHNLADDFNYEFFKFNCDYDDLQDPDMNGELSYFVNMYWEQPCEIVFEYTPIIRDSI